MNTSVEQLYNTYRERAYKKKISFELTIQQFYTFIRLPCKYCGKERSNKYNGLYYNGIDRIDNEKGYDAINCIPCCFNCNRAKSDRTMGEFIDWIKDVINHLEDIEQMYTDLIEQIVKDHNVS